MTKQSNEFSCSYLTKEKLIMKTLIVTTVTMLSLMIAFATNDARAAKSEATVQCTVKKTTAFGGTHKYIITLHVNGKFFTKSSGGASKEGALSECQGIKAKTCKELNTYFPADGSSVYVGYGQITYPIKLTIEKDLLGDKSEAVKSCEAE